MSTTHERSEVAQLVEARDTVKASLELMDGPTPAWWPALDLQVQQLNRGDEYDVRALLRGIDAVASFMGPRFAELEMKISTAARVLHDKIDRDADSD